MTNEILATAIRKILSDQAKQATRTRKEPYVRLFGDAKPSESIQEHELPGLGVAAIFAWGDNTAIVDVPINQYKEYDRAHKAEAAQELADWLKAERETNKLAIVGFMNALEQQAAARLGLDLIEELPDTHVKKHYEKYRLFFGNEHVDFAQAVALVYYMFTVSFAILRVSMALRDEDKGHMIALLDRFPDASKGGFLPGKKAPTTQGMKFAQFLKQKAETFTGIDATNKEEGIAYHPDTLEGWRQSNNEEWRDPKTHPHFTLVDWLVAAAIAHRFTDKFIAEYKTTKLGKKGRNAEDTAEALKYLYAEFKKFDIYEITDERTLGMIRSNPKKWEVPEDARQFIFARATG